MRSDLLSKRIFLAGSFGLPWLWVVHVLYNRGLEAATGDPDAGDATNQGLLDADERTYKRERERERLCCCIAIASKKKHFFVVVCRGAVLTFFSYLRIRNSLMNPIVFRCFARLS